MKQKTFFAILSLLMLSLSSFAQAPVKGDVNEDGKVDEDDISAIIEIIKNGQNQPTYYWYVGYDQNAYEHPESFKENMYTTTSNAIPTQYSKSGNNGLDISGTGTRPNYINMILPSTWTIPTLWNETKLGQIAGSILKENVVIEGLPGTYKVWGGDGQISDTIIYIN